MGGGGDLVWIVYSTYSTAIQQYGSVTTNISNVYVYVYIYARIRDERISSRAELAAEAFKVCSALLCAISMTRPVPTDAY